MYRYVGNNPVNLTDPSGNITPLGAAACFALLGAAKGVEFSENMEALQEKGEELTETVNQCPLGGPNESEQIKDQINTLNFGLVDLLLQGIRDTLTPGVPTIGAIASLPIDFVSSD